MQTHASLRVNAPAATRDGGTRSSFKENQVGFLHSGQFNVIPRTGNISLKKQK